jgi:hypothetical protein
MPSLGQLWDIDWLNANSQRHYPLSEEAGSRDTTDSFSIPFSFLVDLIWPVHADPTVDPSKFHIIGIGVFGTGVTVSIGYDGTAVGAVAIDASLHTQNQSYYISGTGDFFDTVGKIVIGSLNEIQQSPGVYTFDLSNGRLETTCIKPDLRGVSALYVKNGDELSEALQGDVVLQAGRNVSLSFVTGVGSEPDRIVINAIDGAGLNADCLCDENADLPCVKTINGIEPDGSGNFTLLDDECLKLDAIANGLQLTDECSKPCCGCTELAVVEETLNFVVTQATSLQNLAERLEAAVTAMEINLLSSKGVANS